MDRNETASATTPRCSLVGDDAALIIDRTAFDVYVDHTAPNGGGEFIGIEVDVLSSS